MKRYSYLRIFGYVVTIVLQLFGLFELTNNVEASLTPEEFALFDKLKFRFNTIHNQIFHIIYAGIGLTDEIMTLLNKRNKTINKLREFHFRFLNDFLLPMAVVVVAVFWTSYWYNPEFVLPMSLKSYQKMCSPLCNHISHTFILIFVLWELLLQPRKSPKSTNLTFGYIYFFGYISLMFLTYVQQGTWIYRAFDVAYEQGMMYFYFLCVSIYLTFTRAYYLQWRVKDYAWRNQVIAEKISKKTVK